MRKLRSSESEGWGGAGEELGTESPTVPKLLLMHSAASQSVNQGTVLAALTVIMNQSIKDR